MTFEYIQTWMIREESRETHDKLLRSWILAIGDNPHLKFIKFSSGSKASPRKRILVYGFDDARSWRRFRESTLNDWRIFVKQWLPYINLDTYKVFIMRKGEYIGK
jgi:hypothetical protein